MTSKARAMANDADEETELPRESRLLQLRERLSALLEALLRQSDSELRRMKRDGRLRYMLRPEALAHVELDGFVYVLSRTPVRTPQKRLSPRELQVAQLIAEGLPTKTVARKLHIRPATVATHLRRIYRKLGVDSRVALAQELLTLS